MDDVTVKTGSDRMAEAKCNGCDELSGIGGLAAVDAWTWAHVCDTPTPMSGDLISHHAHAGKQP